MHIAAYVRVSTDDQNEQRQVVQFWAAQTFDEDDTDAPVRGKVMLEEIAKTDYD
jgi:DNA invertase Pin-like site-specific DNA recombinase